MIKADEGDRIPRMGVLLISWLSRFFDKNGLSKPRAGPKNEALSKREASKDPD